MRKTATTGAASTAAMALLAGALSGCVLDTREGGPTTRAYEGKVYSTPTGLNARTPAFPRAYEPERGEFNRGAWRTGDVFVTGQPDAEALEELIEREGVTLIVSLRTPSEMDRLRDDENETPLDEAGFLRPYTVSHGVEYLELPIGGEDHPPTPAQTDAFAEALARHDTAALVKCSVGGRASQMWAAYLVRHKGFEINEARRHAMAMATTPSTMERLLDVEFEYDIKNRNSD